MPARREQRRNVPTLDHDEAVTYLVDYELGRLPPRINGAIESHIRSCAICQRQGLFHAVTEKREVQRRIRRVRPTRPRISRRGRVILLLVTLVLLSQLVVLGLLRDGSPFGLITHGIHSAGTAAPDVTSTVVATPVALQATQTFGAASTDAAAVALAPDGKVAALSLGTPGAATVALWDVATGKQSDTLPWPGSAVPGVLAWSLDGKQLAAADGDVIVAWTAQTRTVLWQLKVPAAPALRVYDVAGGGVAQRPDTATAFANGTLLRWESTGQVSSAPAPAAASATHDPTLIGPWLLSATHLFATAKGSVSVGIAPDDTAHHAALLTWSPDGRFILWGQVAQPVALPASAPSTSSTPSATTPTPASGATPTTTAAAGVPLPNSVVTAAAANLARDGQGDALLWPAPSGNLLAICDRSAPTNSTLRVYSLANGRALAVVPGGCEKLALTGLAWQPAGTAFVLALPGKPVAVYAVSAPAN